MDPLDGAELARLRGQVADLLRFRAKAALQRCKKLTYKSGDKCGRLLARALRDQRASFYIPYVIGDGGGKLHLPKEISQCFGYFHSRLYSIPQIPFHPYAVSSYLDSVPLPRIPSQAREAMETPFTSDELSWAIKSSKTGKAPGPDGFIVLYYHELQTLLIPHMLKLFNSLGQTSSFHDAT